MANQSYPKKKAQAPNLKSWLEIYDRLGRVRFSDTRELYCLLGYTWLWTMSAARICKIYVSTTTPLFISWDLLAQRFLQRMGILFETDRIYIK